MWKILYVTKRFYIDFFCPFLYFFLAQFFHQGLHFNLFTHLRRVDTRRNLQTAYEMYRANSHKQVQ